MEGGRKAGREAEREAAAVPQTISMDSLTNILEKTCSFVERD